MIITSPIPNTIDVSGLKESYSYRWRIESLEMARGFLPQLSAIMFIIWWWLKLGKDW